MQVEHEIIDHRGKFFIEKNNVSVAEMDYKMTDKKTLVITHTEVDERLEGKGIGKQLVGSAVEYARKNSLVINATCPFAKAVLDKSAEFSDVYQN